MREKRRNHEKIAPMMLMVFFFVMAFGVQIARNTRKMNRIEMSMTTVENIPFTRFARSIFTSCISIPKRRKNDALSGLNTIYARKLPKKMSAVKNTAMMKRKNVPASIVRVSLLSVRGVSSVSGL